MRRDSGGSQWSRSAGTRRAEALRSSRSSSPSSSRLALVARRVRDRARRRRRRHERRGGDRRRGDGAAAAAAACDEPQATVHRRWTRRTHAHDETACRGRRSRVRVRSRTVSSTRTRSRRRSARRTAPSWRASSTLAREVALQYPTVDGRGSGRTAPGRAVLARPRRALHHRTPARLGNADGDDDRRRHPQAARVDLRRHATRLAHRRALLHDVDRGSGRVRGLERHVARPPRHLHQAGAERRRRRAARCRPRRDARSSATRSAAIC